MAPWTLPRLVRAEPVAQSAYSVEGPTEVLEPVFGLTDMKAGQDRRLGMALAPDDDLVIHLGLEARTARP